MDSLEMLDYVYSFENESSGEVTHSSSDELTHYGILGMKWGVRRTPEQLGHKRKKKDRRYPDETDQEYQNRMNRESQERITKMQLKSKSEEQKRTLKSEERKEKARIKAQEKKDRAAQKKQEKKTRSNLEKGKLSTPSAVMTDEELRDAINRIRLEKEYKQLTKKPDGFMKASIKKVGGIGGGILVSTGKAVATKYLTAYATKKIDTLIDKRTGSKIDKKNAAAGILYLPGEVKKK